MNLKFHIHLQLLVKHKFRLYYVSKPTENLLINKLINAQEIWHYCSLECEQFFK